MATATKEQKTLLDSTTVDAETQPLVEAHAPANLPAVQQSQPSEALAIIQTAIERNIDADQLGKLMDLHRELRKDQAAEAFGRAVTTFQAKCPPITKSRATQETGSFGYKYASFDDVMRVAGPVLAECGLAVTVSSERTDWGIRVTCRLRHGTHFEDHTMDCPIPSMKVNDTQKFGAALSYAKRYALCAALNIVITDEDNDAAGLGVEPIATDEIANIKSMLNQIAPGDREVVLKKLLEWGGVKRLEDFPADKYAIAVTRLEAKIKEYNQ